MFFHLIRHQYKLPYFEGVLEPNTKLQQAAKLLEGKLAGPESITSDRNGEILMYSEADRDVVFVMLIYFNQPPRQAPPYRKLCESRRE